MSHGANIQIDKYVYTHDKAALVTIRGFDVWIPLSVISTASLPDGWLTTRDIPGPLILRVALWWIQANNIDEYFPPPDGDPTPSPPLDAEALAVRIARALEVLNTFVNGQPATRSTDIVDHAIEILNGHPPSGRQP